MKRKPSQTRPGIVCGTDFTENAKQAGNVAAALAATLHQRLLLVHAVEHKGDRRLSPQTRRALLNPVRADLRLEATRLRRRGATVVEELHTGNADEVLVRRARECGAHLVVLSSLGTSTTKRRLLGSVAERTAESSPATTLVVRWAAPFETWLRGERPLRVFVAFDFTVTAEAAVAWVRDLRMAGPCDVIVGYANWPPEELERFGVRSHAPAFENPPVVQQALERDLRDKVALILGSDDAQARVRAGWERADSTLIDMAKAAQADLIVTGTHQRRGLSRLWSLSLSRGLLCQAPVSVACVPVAATARRVLRLPVLRRVLVTTDFSTHGNYAIAYACAVAQRGGLLRLVHVVHPRAIAGGEFETQLGSTARHASFVQGVGRRLQSLVPPEAQALGITVEASVVECEDTAKGIGQEAERYGADVIVIGSQGLSGVERAVLGSVTQAVMTHSRRPVFVVRPPKE